jgi:hypothetical protein
LCRNIDDVENLFIQAGPEDTAHTRAHL